MLKKLIILIKNLNINVKFILEERVMNNGRSRKASTGRDVRYKVRYLGAHVFIAHVINREVDSSSRKASVNKGLNS